MHISFYPVLFFICCNVLWKPDVCCAWRAWLCKGCGEIKSWILTRCFVASLFLSNGFKFRSLERYWLFTCFMAFYVHSIFIFSFVCIRYVLFIFVSNFVLEFFVCKRWSTTGGHRCRGSLEWREKVQWPVPRHKPPAHVHGKC